MSDVIEYKCPFCGGAMEFDSKSQHMKCLYCNTEMTVEEFQRTQKPEAEAATEKKMAKENWFSLSSGQWQKEETNRMRVYSCQSCGGEIVADSFPGILSRIISSRSSWTRKLPKKDIIRIWKEENICQRYSEKKIMSMRSKVSTFRSGYLMWMRMFRLHMKRKKFMYRNPMIRSIQPERSIGLFVAEASVLSTFRRMPPEKWTIP